MLDFDLARVYGVETKSLNRAVKRNADRFPKDFMFQISSHERKNLKHRIGTSSSKQGSMRSLIVTASGGEAQCGAISERLHVPALASANREDITICEILVASEIFETGPRDWGQAAH